MKISNKQASHTWNSGSELESIATGTYAAMLVKFHHRFARAGTLAHLSCSHTPHCFITTKWCVGPKAIVPAPHPANGVISSRRFGRAHRTHALKQMQLRNFQGRQVRTENRGCSVSPGLFALLLAITLRPLWCFALLWSRFLFTSVSRLLLSFRFSFPSPCPSWLRRSEA